MKNCSLHLRCWFVAVLSVFILSFPACTPEQPLKKAEPFPDQRLDGPNNKPTAPGVVLAYRKGVAPKEDQPVDIAVGQTLVVRVHNIDGWLITKLLDRRIVGEPEMNFDQREIYVFIHRSKGEQETVDAFIRKYEVAEGKVVSPEPVPVPGTVAPEKPVDATPPPLPKNVTTVKMREAKNAFEGLLNAVKRELFLAVNNSQLRQLRAENPESGIVNKEVGALKDNTVHEFEFRLRRLPGDEKAWGSLYDGTRAVHDVRVSIGFELDRKIFVLDSAVFPQAVKPVQRVRLELFSSMWLTTILCSLAVVLMVIIALGASTALLRDADLPLRADGCPQFSLSRLQLAFWTYVVVGSFLVIWLVTDRLDTLNTTILTLLGISSGTTFASKIASSVTLSDGKSPAEPKRAARRNRSVNDLIKMINEELTDLEGEAETLERERLAQPSPELDHRAGRLAVRIARLKEDLDYLSRSPVTRFCIDLLAENGRVTLHRLQIIVWTVVLGVVFIHRVAKELSMPTFDNTLLGLMGLSSLTYVALKVPELKRVERDIKSESPDAR